ncbi:MAG: hypothetical protein IPN90_02390 [Elusimicrobia bacterium]|nr:hypothetical protein [Elusimicrobiota bacterium]
MDDKEKRDRAFDDHALDQALRIARTTTFEQRFRWLEQTIDFLRPQLRENYEQQKRLGLLRDE